MYKLQNRRAPRKFLLVAMIAATLGGCSTSRQQPPAVNADAVSTPAVAAMASAQNANAKPVVIHAVPSAEVSRKKTAAMILAQIHRADLKEVAIGKISEEKASTDEIRAYADQLVKDHTNADQLVVAMAQKTGAHLYGSATAPVVESRDLGAHGNLVNRKLSAASGARFDRLFLKETNFDDETLMRELQQEREDASDDDIEALIDKIMPILQQHRDLAQILMKKEQGQGAPIPSHG